MVYKLRAIVNGVRSDGLLKANEEMTAWLRGDRSMPFGPGHQHVTVRLIDFDDLAYNQYVVTSQFTFRAGVVEKRADLVLLVKGLPLVVIEAKTPVRQAVSWLDGALQVHDATLPLHFEPRQLKLHIDKPELDRAYEALTGRLTALDKDNLAKAGARMAVVVKVPARVAAICADIAQPRSRRGCASTWATRSSRRFQTASKP